MLPVELVARSGTGSVSVAGCFAAWSMEERLYGRNQYNCTVCGKHVDATKYIGLLTFPPLLCVQFKRFAFNTRGGSRKILSPLHFGSNADNPFIDLTRAAIFTELEVRGFRGCGPL